ncbi:MAG TPA: alpha-ketoglutarate-dependent dioxygenase AlkB [Acidimicrobiia bacterium]
MATYQPTLLGAGEPRVDEGATPERITLDEQSWVDVTRVWLLGADTLLEALISKVDWKCGRRRMYDRMLDDPRLSRWYARGDARPHPAFGTMTKHLEAGLGVRLPTVGCNYYRDGDDSVAWHADRELRELGDTRIAIVTLGARRPFLIRPKGGGRSVDVAPAAGDLLVMGGACQMGWEHSVPKKRSSGPRISCSWRWCRPAHVPVVP